MYVSSPEYLPPLDPDFSPLCLYNRAYQQKVAQTSIDETARFRLAVEREEGLTERRDVDILTSTSYTEETYCYVERHLKFILWAVGGWRIFIEGPDSLCRRLQNDYSRTGNRSFDAEIMEKVYGSALDVQIVEDESEMPPSRRSSQPIGGHLEGCRIGFDLGASDFKIAAVQDGEAVFSTEIPWDPGSQTDPSYHYRHITDGLKQAASNLPRVDAIGGSAAGIYINNEAKVGSLFRNIPEDRFDREIKNLFRRIQQEWGVPLVVVNDGDVTALAGAISLETANLLGIAMGSSEAAGYVDENGRITGFLNELAFAPVDNNPEATLDEWSGDRGTGALYFSQQAVNKLLPDAGIELPSDMSLADRLKDVQALADAGDERAHRIFETLGVYLGYSLIHYHDYYNCANVLLLGRVTSGTGGQIILDKARTTLEGAFPDLAPQITVTIPDEKQRRVGQAVAAASLPALDKK